MFSIYCHSDVNLDSKFEENGSDFSGGCAKGLAFKSNRQNVYILTFRSFSFFFRFTASDVKSKWIMMKIITFNVTNTIAYRQNEVISKSILKTAGLEGGQMSDGRFTRSKLVSPARIELKKLSLKVIKGLWKFFDSISCILFQINFLNIVLIFLFNDRKSFCQKIHVAFRNSHILFVTKALT